MSDLTNTYLGQFRIIELIRPGMMMTIYKAYQPALDRFVAIKVLPAAPPSLDLDYAMHFKLAAQEIAKVHHPHILRIHDYGEQDGQRYLVLQYIEGGTTLTDILGKPLELATVVQLVGQLLDGLEYAHQRGVIHGDVKPSNVLLTTSGWPILTDFGIVKRMNDSERLMLSGEVIGTPHYMAPETAAARAIDARTDLYALGVVLYEMLTGKVLFDDPDPMAVLTKHVHMPPPSPRHLNPDMPAEIEAVVLRALAKDPAARYQSAAEMSKALTLAAAQLPHNPAQSQITGAYLNGVQAFAAGRWEVAIERFSQVAALDPTYEDVAKLLETAQDNHTRIHREAQRQLALVRQQQRIDHAESEPPRSLSTPISTRETVQLEAITESIASKEASVVANPASSAEAHKALVRRWIEEIWNKGDIALVDQLFDGSSTEGIRQAAIEWRSTFPDAVVTIEQLIAEENTVVVRWMLRGKQPMRIAGVTIARIVAGKIVQLASWTLTQQASVLPSLGQGGS